MADPRRKRDLEAAPPDDGGHLGSYTTPGDDLVEGLGEGRGKGRERGAPDLHYINDTPGRDRHAWSWPLLAVAIALIVGLLALSVYAP